MLSSGPNSGGEGDDHNKIRFKLWRLLELEVTGRDAIHAGKAYMCFGVVCLAQACVLFYSAQTVGFERIVFLFAR